MYHLIRITYSDLATENCRSQVEVASGLFPQKEIAIQLHSASAGRVRNLRKTALTRCCELLPSLYAAAALRSVQHLLSAMGFDTSRSVSPLTAHSRNSTPFVSTSSDTPPLSSFPSTPHFPQSAVRTPSQSLQSSQLAAGFFQDDSLQGRFSTPGPSQHPAAGRFLSGMPGPPAGPSMQWNQTFGQSNSANAFSMAPDAMMVK